ncbi:cardiolipin synthetase [Bacillus coahuilensis p1.1.43]|uniref:Cardiolipin synthase n=1 Tax=Bacillus coahuilensis p1.1.43 TaxID=1150625 RepID=A0A147K447_9BACI|nr:cardiolipin synthase [Bacillus coahuilensis]KUP04075.1 cardiolipin synthetase [Bacillus coahuilensis p1.1.43]
MLWILLLFVLFFTWIRLDFISGRAFHKRHTTHRDYPKRASDLQFIANGPELYDDVFDEMKQATSSIHILSYTFEPDEFGQEFMERLIEKAKEGLEVRLLFDRFGSLKMKKKHVRHLREHGVYVAISQLPHFPFFFYTSQQRNHRKIMVMDGTTGYIGGYNIGKQYVNQDCRLNPWRDYHLKVQGEGVKDLQREFLLDWKRATVDNLVENETYYPPLKEGRHVLQYYPSDGNGLDQLFLSFIQRAYRSIVICTPYFIPTEEIETALVHALKRGVRVQILVPEMKDHMLVKEAAYPHFRKLLPLGAEVYQFNKGFFHGKVFILDDELCDVGTANFDYRSFFLNFELNTLIYDKTFINEVQSVIEQDMSSSTRLTIDELNSLSFLDRVKEMIARLVKYFL